MKANFGQTEQSTICAVATPQGVGGISVIRVSGPCAIANVRKIAEFLPSEPKSHRIYFGNIKSIFEKQIIDEVLISIFLSGKSFTGEETAEISCHGNPNIVLWILNELTLAGCRAANRGEFTYRAFMNGRIDLVQAESVLALIESQSKKSAQISLRQLKGDLSQQLLKLEDGLSWLLAHLEASIDFSTEEIQVVSDHSLLDKLTNLSSVMTNLLSGYKAGRLIKEGLHVVLSGAPNVGKSSLLNLVSGEDRAIVTDVPGTTRDILEARVLVSGVVVTFIDTAGLRESTEKVESIGIKKSLKARQGADVNFFIFDMKKGLSSAELRLLSDLDCSNTFIIGNKADLYGAAPEQRINEIKEVVLKSNFFKQTGIDEEFFQTNVFFISAFDENSRNTLFSALDEYLGKSKHEESSLIFQSRHFENLTAAFENLERARLLVSNQASAEFISLELKEAFIKVQEILGKRFDDEILDRVFKEFCIGK